MARANFTADTDPSVLRVSMDSKARVKIGNLSRGGKDRHQMARVADDHDTQWHTTLLPFGILNLRTDDLTIYMSESPETADLIVDCLQEWWSWNRADFPEVKTLAINLDGGSATRSNRTQFIRRMGSLEPGRLVEVAKNLHELAVEQLENHKLYLSLPHHWFEGGGV